MAAASQVIPANTIVEEGIPGEDNPMSHQANAIRRMSRRMKDGEVKLPRGGPDPRHLELVQILHEFESIDDLEEARQWVANAVEEKRISEDDGKAMVDGDVVAEATYAAMIRDEKMPGT